MESEFGIFDQNLQPNRSLQMFVPRTHFLFLYAYLNIKHLIALDLSRQNYINYIIYNPLYR